MPPALLIAFAVAAAMVVVAYAFLDRPFALWAHHDLPGTPWHHPPALHLLEALAELPVPVAIVAAIYFGVAGTARGLRHPERALLAIGVAVGLASAFTRWLKLAFGRTWPETWIHDNPSFIRDGAFGFAPFHGGPGWESFPSGHMTVITALCGVLWIAYPRLCLLWSLPVVLVAIGLLGLNYHFVSDVIAGAYVGSATACVVSAWLLRGPDQRG